ncbi:hypothetical protein ABT324_14915 [Saccharopolyspora sp. NPDC000359]|uniref:hypothetical protein n=1 Tax=Saccharopolyspora sp. NPDC000359 TaxID=3154251 RepID=UPI003325C060
MSQSFFDDLEEYVVLATGADRATANRLVHTIVENLNEPVDDYVRRRHRELQDCGYKNSKIWEFLRAELATRPLAPPRFSERQLRRIVYG